MPATQVASVPNYDFGAPAAPAPVLTFRVRNDQGGKQAVRFENTGEVPYAVTTEVSPDGQAWGTTPVSEGVVPAVAATFVTAFGDPDGDILFTAVTPGLAGNAITIEFVDPAGNNQPLDISVVGTDIVVSLPTDGSGNIDAYATDIIDAINLDVDASALVVASLPPTSDGGSGVEEFGPENLTNGADAATGPTPTIDVPPKEHRNGEVLLRAGVDRFFRVVASGSARGQMQIRSDAILEIVRV